LRDTRSNIYIRQRLKARLARRRVPAICRNDNFGHWESEFAQVVEHCRSLGGAPARLATLLNALAHMARVTKADVRAAGRPQRPGAATRRAA
jgi:hypothetical protein